ncbi:MAG: hypothetical protein GF364_06630 [Candidatus Lokiarchaeota archaeon]|nr:hypothetical protein [Candidatus Lokiarchaeota archaeon]
MNNTILKINSLKSKFEEKITCAFSKIELDNYQIAWKNTQDITTKEVKRILENEFDSIDITIPKSKSTYPDIKIENEDGIFAIDIKSNESQKNPWFDMARLDTIFQERINKYDEEWEIVIKYDSETKKFLDVYFLLFREVVGIRDECNGVKYRPYDGKIRPKSWKDFDNNVIYWKTKEEFLIGIKNSLKHRWKKNIEEHLIPKLNIDEKIEFRKLFE